MIAPCEFKTGKPIPKGWVYLADVQRRMGLGQSSTAHIAKKHGVEIKVDRQKRHWVDPEAFADAYEANGNPEATMEGMIKVSDLAIKLGYSRSTIVTICAELRIVTAKLRTRGNQGYLTPEQAARIAERKRRKPGVPKGTRLTITPPPRLTPGPELPPPMITAIQHQQIMVTLAEAQFARERERHKAEGKREPRPQQPQLKPVDSVDGWRKELQAARKRGTRPIQSPVVVSTLTPPRVTAEHGPTCRFTQAQSSTLTQER